MRFIVYLAGLAVLVYLGVVIFQVIMKRITSNDLARAKDLTEARNQRDQLQRCVTTIMKYCDDVVLVDDTNLTALNVLNIIHTKETSEA